MPKVGDLFLLESYYPGPYIYIGEDEVPGTSGLVHAALDIQEHNLYWYYYNEIKKATILQPFAECVSV